MNNFFIKEPSWRDANRWFLGQVPQNTVDWLLESNSLTQRLRTTFSAPFSVSLMGQTWARPLLNDALCLGQSPDHYALVREVLLNIDNKAVVFARSTLPRSVARQLQKLTGLGSRPLGEVIFAYPDLQRVRLEFAKIPLRDLSPLVQQKMAGHRYIWGRRNSYQIKDGVFLVNEFFLPTLFNE